ncbi:MAG: very short patch repair endonuclease [Adlercreutzia sp.]|nr:very short patch repair endonuclease [Adlercreutzia sp.]
MSKKKPRNNPEPGRRATSENTPDDKGAVAASEQTVNLSPDEAAEKATLRPSPKKGYDFGVVSTATRKSMQGNKRRDTKPEILVRRMLREMGFTGYRCDWRKAPGRPDVAFVGRKLAIFVMGCFWHRCPVCNLSTPKKNTPYWEEKFARNIERDERNLAALEEAGWKVLVLWEHQLKKKELPATRRLIYEFVRRESDPPYDEAFPEEPTLP